jgi:hypothetical protein
VANLPAVADEKFRNAVLEAFWSGQTPNQLAKRVYPTDKVKRTGLRARIWKLAETDGELARRIHARAHIALLAGLGPATTALARRSERGNVPAIKLLYEASNYHNPRVQHEHSGEITVKLDMPRPKFVADGAVDSTAIEDADVVDGS